MSAGLRQLLAGLRRLKLDRRRILTGATVLGLVTVGLVSLIFMSRDTAPDSGPAAVSATSPSLPSSQALPMITTASASASAELPSANIAASTTSSASTTTTTPTTTTTTTVAAAVRDEPPPATTTAPAAAEPVGDEEPESDRPESGDEDGQASLEQGRAADPGPGTAANTAARETLVSEGNQELPVLPPAEAPPPPRLPQVVPDGDLVYFTFDDGPHPVYTPQVLDVLARHGVQATFFVIGKMVELYPEVFERIIAEGHTVANHTWNHESLAGLSRAEFDRTVSATQAILGEHATPCIRPPYGATDASTKKWSAAHGLDLHMWSVSPSDWLQPPAEEIADYIVKRIRPGSVVLLHDGGGPRAETVRGLDLALEQLAERNYNYAPLCF